jgi:hypothetical protein
MSTYPNAEIRDIVLATGLIDGVETSYARPEGALEAAPARFAERNAGAPRR